MVVRHPPAAAAFRAEKYGLPGPGTAMLELSPVRHDEAAGLAARLSREPPWSSYPIAAAQLERLFQTSGDGAVVLALRTPDQPAPLGVAVVRWPWLRGPYMQFLGLDPRFQGCGIGGRVLAWMDAEARHAGAANLWICVASFNVGAHRLYSRCGFETVAALDDLVKDGVPEILMRKRLT
jgi:diamine N-acetyltransferase